MKLSVRPLLVAALAVVAAIVGACSTADRGLPAPGTPQQAPLPAPTPPAAVQLPVPAGTALATGAAIVVPPIAQLPTVSHAGTALAYRRDAATHLYAHNSERIYKGMMRPNLYAIGVLDVDINRQGQVTGISWRRAPRHAPEVMAEIVRTVRQAAPYPVPTRMGRVTYSDIWLWDKSGQFQLDTLTEGQL